MSHATRRQLFFVPLLSLVACANSPSSSVAINDDSSCPLTLKSGQTLTLSLPADPTSGYRWNLQDATADQLKCLGPEVFSTPNGDLVGGEGISTWRFEAKNVGSGRLFLTYQRPWETNDEPSGLFDCRIEVQ